MSSAEPHYEIGVPVQELPYSCNAMGFPLVLKDGILGCDQQGKTNQWLDFFTNQVHSLPTGQWLSGDQPFMIGPEGGMWNLESGKFEQPRQRLIEEISENSVRIRGQKILWSTIDSVNIFDLGSNQIQRIPATPLLGQPPDLLKGVVAWIEWGEVPGIVLWDTVTEDINKIPFDHPTQLVCSKVRCGWISNLGIHTMTDVGSIQLYPSAGVQHLTIYQDNLCWNEVLDGINSVHCLEGAIKIVEVYPFEPQLHSSGMYFKNDGRLWKFLE